MLQKIKDILAYVGIGVHPRQKKYLFNQDSIITSTVAGFPLKITKSHSLAFNVRNYPGYNQNIARLANFVFTHNPGCGMIDVGANVGDTVAFVRRLSEIPVICVEADGFYLQLLQENILQFANVTAFQYLLSDSNEAAYLSMKKAAGTASATSSAEGTQTEMVTLDWFTHEKKQVPLPIKLLKIDTDGYDPKILRGAQQFLAAQKPVLFFEYDTEFMRETHEDGLAMLNMLQNLGYNHVLYYDNLGRMLISTSLNNPIQLKQLHNYISGYEGAFRFYDLCIFHRTDDTLAEKFITVESGGIK